MEDDWSNPAKLLNGRVDWNCGPAMLNGLENINVGVEFDGKLVFPKCIPEFMFERPFEKGAFCCGLLIWASLDVGCWSIDAEKQGSIFGLKSVEVDGTAGWTLPESREEFRSKNSHNLCWSAIVCTRRLNRQKCYQPFKKLNDEKKARKVANNMYKVLRFSTSLFLPRRKNSIKQQCTQLVLVMFWLCFSGRQINAVNTFIFKVQFVSVF